MKIIKNITDDEMISIFLKGEINSKRFGLAIKKEITGLNIKEKVITNPDIFDIQENEFRKQIFSNYRDYGGNKGLFENFPKNIKWIRAQITRDELLKIKYINYDYWIELSDGSRLSTCAAKKIKEGTEVFGTSNKNFLEAAEWLRQGKTFPELIIVGENINSYFVALEGHLRLTAYALTPDYIPELNTVVAGLSEKIGQWPEY